MAIKNSKKDTVEELLRTTNQLIRDQIIIHLGSLGVKQQEIRKIVGGDIVRVNNIVKNLKKKESKNEK